MDGAPHYDLALGDERSGGHGDRADASGIYIDDDDAERATYLFRIETFVEGEPLFHGALIGYGLQAQADGEACDFSAESFLIALDEEDVEFAGPDGVLLREVEVRSGDGDAESASGSIRDKLCADGDFAGVGGLPDGLRETVLERSGLLVVLIAATETERSIAVATSFTVRRWYLPSAGWVGEKPSR